MPKRSINDEELRGIFVEAGLLHIALCHISFPVVNSKQKKKKKKLPLVQKPSLPTDHPVGIDIYLSRLRKGHLLVISLIA